MNKSVIEDTMWTFLSMGAQKGNPARLNAYVQDLIHMAKQKNAGQAKYKHKGDISFDYVEPIKWSIIIEAAALCLDEKFQKVLDLFNENGKNINTFAEEEKMRRKGAK